MLSPMFDQNQRKTPRQQLSVFSRPFHGLVPRAGGVPGDPGGNGRVPARRLRRTLAQRTVTPRFSPPRSLCCLPRSPHQWRLPNRPSRPRRTAGGSESERSRHRHISVHRFIKPRGRVVARDDQERSRSPQGHSGQASQASSLPAGFPVRAGVLSSAAPPLTSLQTSSVAAHAAVDPGIDLREPLGLAPGDDRSRCDARERPTVDRPEDQRVGNAVIPSVGVMPYFSQMDRGLVGMLTPRSSRLALFPSLSPPPSSTHPFA